MSTLSSKKFTSTDSVRIEARICSKEMLQSASTVPPLRASPPTSTVSSARSSHWGPGAGGSSSPGAVSRSFLPSCPKNLFPTSPMRSSRLATVAMAWYKSCSLGSSLNIRGLSPWLNQTNHTGSSNWCGVLSH
uniref:Uncharacterized protein n=1 Tax=Rhinolophus ferrumequinum TaxID=59479 RepID=A0A671G378_RHIFE